jgi:hypothetical protein
MITTVARLDSVLARSRRRQVMGVGVVLVGVLVLLALVV